jgi:lysophospholipid acyltransferase (LPLAT)-like uncharacterized protein
MQLVLAYIIRIILRLLLLTCRFHVHGKENLHSAIKGGPSMIALWHNRLLLCAPSLLKITTNEIFTAFISKSRDAEILASYTTSYPRGRAIRVSHNARQHALKALIECLKKTDQIPIITPDGPRGPRYQVKPGIVLAAKETNASIVPFSWESTGYWEIPTWDAFRIPKPFSTINAIFGKPIQLNQEHSMDSALSALQEHLYRNNFKNGEFCKEAP